MSRFTKLLRPAASLLSSVRRADERLFSTTKSVQGNFVSAKQFETTLYFRVAMLDDGLHRNRASEIDALYKAYIASEQDLPNAKKIADSSRIEIFHKATVIEDSIKGDALIAIDKNAKQVAGRIFLTTIDAALNHLTILQAAHPELAEDLIAARLIKSLVEDIKRTPEELQKFLKQGIRLSCVGGYRDLLKLMLQEEAPNVGANKQMQYFYDAARRLVEDEKTSPQGDVEQASLQNIGQSAKDKDLQR